MSKSEVLDVSVKILSICMSFLHEYESTNGLPSICKKYMSEKNVVLELWPKNF